MIDTISGGSITNRTADAQEVTKKIYKSRKKISTAVVING